MKARGARSGDAWLRLTLKPLLLWGAGRLRKLGEGDTPCAAPRPALRVRRLLQQTGGGTLRLFGHRPLRLDFGAFLFLEVSSQ